MSLIPSLIFPDQTFVAFVMYSMHAICNAHPSLFDLEILTVVDEEPDYTIFSISSFVLYFIIPMVHGFKLCLCGTAVFTAHVTNEYEALVERCLTKKQSSRREPCSIAARSTRNLTLGLLVLGLDPSIFLTTLLVMIN